MIDNSVFVKSRNIYRNIFYESTPPICEHYRYNSNKDVIFLIPLFPISPSIQPKRDYIASALWARYSLLRGSNAVKKGVPIKFYIETSYYLENAKRLSNHNINEINCILFEWQNEYNADIAYHDISQPNLALCLLPMLDKRLSNYDRVIISDADSILCTSEPKQFDMIDFAFSVDPYRIGVFSMPKVLAPPRANWLNKFRDSDASLFYVKVNKALEIASPSEFLQTQGAGYIFSPKRLHGANSEFSNIVNRLIHALRDDEAVISIYRQHIKEIFEEITHTKHYSYDSDAIKNNDTCFFFHTYSNIVEILLEKIGVL